ncbi:hypothetical protein Hanom_Chr12g01176721 [Helianthus anomalus]
MSDLQQFHNKLNLLLHFHKLNLDGIIIIEFIVVVFFMRNYVNCIEKKTAFMKIIKKHKRKTGKSLSFMQEDGQELVFIANPRDKLVAECADLLVHTSGGSRNFFQGVHFFKCPNIKKIWNGSTIRVG